MLYRFADCTLNLMRRELRRNGVLCAIEPQVFDLLCYLIEHRERVVTRDEIFQAIWKGRFVSDSVLSTRLNAVRVAIGDDGRAQRLIRTFTKRGIRFVATLHDEFDTDARGAVAAPTHKFRQPFIDAPAIAVVPFASLDLDPHCAQFAEALTDETTGALWRHDWLPVLAGGLGQARSGGELRQFCERMGARVLLGSVRRAGDQMRIVVRLLEARSGRHLWAERREIDATGHATQSLAGRIAQQMADLIFAAEIFRSKVRSEGADDVWSCIVTALGMINTRDKAQLDAADRLLHRALEINPRCARALALLSFTETLRVHLAWRSRVKSRPRALALAGQALAADPDDAWSHLALGYANVQICNEPGAAIEYCSTRCGSIRACRWRTI